MKKKYLLMVAVAAVVGISSCKKDDTTDPGNGGGGSTHVEVAKVQRSLFLDFTATWCPPCGKYGKPGFHSVLTNSANSNKLVGLAVHPSNSELPSFFKTSKNDSAYISPVLGDLSNGVITVSGYPTLFVNNKKLALNNQVAQQAQTEIDAKSGVAPTAGVGLSVSQTANGLKIKSTVQFFEASSGEYYVSILLSEDNIARRQMVGDVGNPSNYYDNGAIHDKVLRGAAVHSSNKDLPKTFGDAPIATGSIAKDAKFTNTYDFTHSSFVGLPSSIDNWAWKPANTNVVAILWKKNGSKYEFVNVTEVRVK